MACLLDPCDDMKLLNPRDLADLEIFTVLYIISGKIFADYRTEYSILPPKDKPL